VLLGTDLEDSLAAYLSFKVLSLDQAPKVISLLVTDLTEQKRQEAIIADGKLIQEILQQAELAIAVCDQSGRIIRASQGVQELCGQNPLLLPFQLVFPLKLSSGKTFLLSPLFQGQSLRNVEASFKRPDGRKIHVVLNAAPLRSKGSQIIGLVASLTDISERRQVEAERIAEVDAGVTEIAAAHPRLRRTGGKKVFELRPDIDWDKGTAVRWLLEVLGLEGTEHVPIYVGDDETDEDAFRAVREHGVGVVVRGEGDDRETAARFALRDTEETRAFLELVAGIAEGSASSTER